MLGRDLPTTAYFFILTLTVPPVITWAEVKVSAGILYFAELCPLPTYNTPRSTSLVSWGAIWFNFPSSLKLSPHLNTKSAPVLLCSKNEV